MSLFFADFKNPDRSKILEYLDSDYFTDSTVTMMNDQYLKDSIRERLCQMVFKNETLVTLNEEQESLKKAMLRSSLSPEDITLILNATLKVSQLSISVASSEEAKEQETDPEKANALLKAKQESMCSLENLIGIIKDNLGTSRIVPVASMGAQMTAQVESMASGQKVEPVKDYIYIERPLEFNLNYLDLSLISNDEIFQFLNVLMASDSNASLGITLPIAALVTPVREFLTTDMGGVLDAAVAFARNSSKNSIMFQAAPDPFKSLFETL